MADHFNVLDQSGGVSVVKARGYVATGDLTSTNVGSTWTQWGALAFAIAAAVGDYVEFEPSFMYKEASSTNIDVAVKVSGSFVRFASSGTGTAAVEGDPSTYYEAETYRTANGAFMDLVVEAGDLDGGNVTFAMVYKGTGTAAILYASSNFPFRYRIRNYGAI